VAEVNPGLQKLSHGDDSHDVLPPSVWVVVQPAGLGGTIRSGRHRRPGVSAGSVGL